eukprot:350730-Chlamydomonas_euryale.AAC.7
MTVPAASVSTNVLIASYQLLIRPSSSVHANLLPPLTTCHPHFLCTLTPDEACQPVPASPPPPRPPALHVPSCHYGKPNPGAIKADFECTLPQTCSRQWCGGKPAGGWHAPSRTWDIGLFFGYQMKAFRGESTKVLGKALRVCGELGPWGTQRGLEEGIKDPQLTWKAKRA